MAKKIKIYENKSNSMIDKRKQPVIIIKNRVNILNKQPKYRYIGSILKNSINSKIINSISLGNNLYENTESVANLNIKNTLISKDSKKTDDLLNEANSSSINLL